MANKYSVKRGCACSWRRSRVKPLRSASFSRCVQILRPILPIWLTGRQSALPLVEAEEETPLWYAIEFPGTNRFGIIDFFPSEAGRGLHLNGAVAKALFEKAEELLEGSPEVVMTEVLGATLQ